MELFRKGFVDVMQNSIGITPQDSLFVLKQGYISSIELLESGIVIYIIANKELLVLLAQNLLFEDQPDEETLQDLAKELTNLVVGKTKVLLQEKGGHFTISTPTFYDKQKVLQHYDQGVHFKIGEDAHCSIFMRGQ